MNGALIPFLSQGNQRDTSGILAGTFLNKPQGMTVDDFYQAAPVESNYNKVQDAINENTSGIAKFFRGASMALGNPDPYAARFEAAKQMDAIARQNAQARQQAKNNFHNYQLDQERMNNTVDYQNRSLDLTEQRNQQTADYQQGMLGVQQDRNTLQQQQMLAELLKAQQEANSPDVKGEGDLRKEFEKEISSFKEVGTAYDRMLAAKPNAAGDLSLIFNYMKMLDPGSTVRETEFANAQNADGVPGRIRSLYNSLKSGERLNPEQRAEFLGQAGGLFKARENQFTLTKSRYSGLAGDYGYNPERIVRDFQYGSAKQQEPSVNQDNMLSDEAITRMQKYLTK